jgi:hypothetical protein
MHASPDYIMQIGLGFWASKTLLSAVELGVFTALGQRPKTGAELSRRLQLQTVLELGPSTGLTKGNNPWPAQFPTSTLRLGQSIPANMA